MAKDEEEMGRTGGLGPPAQSRMDGRQLRHSDGGFLRPGRRGAGSPAAWRLPASGVAADGRIGHRRRRVPATGEEAGGVDACRRVLAAGEEVGGADGRPGRVAGSRRWRLAGSGGGGFGVAAFGGCAC